MSIAKEQVVDMLRAQGQHDKALQVASALPRRVDPERDAGLLQSFEITLSDLAPGDQTRRDR